MSRPAGAAGRSGDPRKRAGVAAQPVDKGFRERGVVTVVAVAVLVALGWLALRPDGGQADDAAGEHADVACDLTTKAGEVAQLDTSARYAAAVLLLDKAMTESRRAAESDARFAELDDAVREVHRAGHRRDPDQWQSALDFALSTCRSSVD